MEGDWLRLIRIHDIIILAWWPQHGKHLKEKEVNLGKYVVYWFVVLSSTSTYLLRQQSSSFFLVSEFCNIGTKRIPVLSNTVFRFWGGGQNKVRSHKKILDYNV